MNRIQVNIGFLIVLAVAGALFYATSLAGIEKLERVVYPVTVLLLLGVFLILDAINILRKDRYSEQAKEIFVKKDTLVKICCMSAATLVYLLAMNHLGFFTTSFLYMIFLFKLLKVKDNGKIVLISAGALASIYIIFIAGLGLNFAQGLLY